MFRSSKEKTIVVHMGCDTPPSGVSNQVKWHGFLERIFPRNSEKRDKKGPSLTNYEEVSFLLKAFLPNYPLQEFLLILMKSKAVFRIATLAKAVNRSQQISRWGREDNKKILTPYSNRPHRRSSCTLPSTMQIQYC